MMTNIRKPLAWLMALAVALSIAPVTAAHNPPPPADPDAATSSQPPACIINVLIVHRFCATGTIENNDPTLKQALYCAGTGETYHCHVFFWLTVVVDGVSVCGRVTSDATGATSVEKCVAVGGDHARIGPINVPYDNIPDDGRTVTATGTVCVWQSGAPETTVCETWTHKPFRLPGARLDTSAMALPSFVVDDLAPWVENQLP